MGIPPGDIDKVFDKFHQVTKGDTLKDKPKGSGLGLAICRQIIERYGGRIWAESKTGKGSKFTFALPCFTPP
jgi:signal transduction histidine kinase